LSREIWLKYWGSFDGGTYLNYMIFGCRLSAIEGDQPPLPPMANPILPPIGRRFVADWPPIANQP
jgi:hypothetical protein